MEDAGPAPEKRIGDSERRAIDHWLRQAQADGVLTLSEYDERCARCWAARTRSELDALVGDLPDYRPDPPTAAAGPVVPAAPAPARRSRVGRFVGATLATVAVIAGVQVVTADDAVVLFGGRTVAVQPGQEAVEVAVLFGGVEVVVPDDARVDTSGIFLFGGTRCDAACDGSGTRTVTVESRGAFGGVQVVRQSERAEREAEEAREDRREQLEDEQDD